MKKLSIFLSFVLGAAAFALAGSGTTGNGAPSGAHYNLNIIGVDNPKSTPMTGGDGHTIFVALGSKKPAAPVESNIWLTQGAFQVCDANGFDPAYACSGAQIGRGQNGAVFQLPCNTLVPTDFGCVNGTVQEPYTVWARALGGPKGSATMTTCAYDDTGALICNTGDNIVSLNRGHGKQTFQNVTTQLTTLQDVCFDLNTVPTCGDVSLFNNDLQDYVWQYQNNGLRLAQIRFYPQ
jgi:hypothetical protein